MKKTYLEPALDIIFLEDYDIITESTSHDSGDVIVPEDDEL